MEEIDRSCCRSGPGLAITAYSGYADCPAFHQKQAMPQASLSEITSPFQRLRDLIEGEEPGAAPIDMTIGEPRHGFPEFASAILQEHAKAFGKYPPIAGIPELRSAIASWMARRYGLPEGAINPARHIAPLCGTREGLVSALVIATARKGHPRPAVLMPNPFYQAYYAAALTSHAEPVFLDAQADSGFLPDLSRLEPALLNRTAAIYLASPANPQGAVAPVSYLSALITLARRHGFYIFSDECYSEIYANRPPTGILEAAAQTGSLDRVLSFNSLSKRSNAPGLRSGFVAGDPAFIKDFLKYRNVASPQIPIPVQHASAALWNDEAHVEASRALYRAKFEAAGQILGRLPGYSQPEGGFFLWLDLENLGGGEEAATRLWKGCGVKILPGAYLAQPGLDGSNPARNYARLALVDPLPVTRDALERLASILL